MNGAAPSGRQTWNEAAAEKIRRNTEAAAAYAARKANNKAAFEAFVAAEKAKAR